MVTLITGKTLIVPQLVHHADKRKWRRYLVSSVYICGFTTYFNMHMMISYELKKPLKMGQSIKNPHTPCGRFEKSVPQRECEFSNAPTLRVILDQVYLRGSKYLI